MDRQIEDREGLARGQRLLAADLMERLLSGEIPVQAWRKLSRAAGEGGTVRIIHDYVDTTVLKPAEADAQRRGQDAMSPTPEQVDLMERTALFLRGDKEFSWPVKRKPLAAAAGSIGLPLAILAVIEAAGLGILLCVARSWLWFPAIVGFPLVAAVLSLMLLGSMMEDTGAQAARAWGSHGELTAWPFVSQQDLADARAHRPPPEAKAKLPSDSAKDESVERLVDRKVALLLTEYLLVGYVGVARWRSLWPGEDRPDALFGIRAYLETVVLRGLPEQALAGAGYLDHYQRGVLGRVTAFLRVPRTFEWPMPSMTSGRAVFLLSFLGFLGTAAALFAVPAVWYLHGWAWAMGLPGGAAVVGGGAHMGYKALRRRCGRAMARAWDLMAEIGVWPFRTRRDMEEAADA